MDDCQRCGARMHWNSGTTELAGGAQALLCLACRNAWHAYFLTLPEHQDFQKLLAQKETLEGRATAGQAPTEFEWLEYISLHQRLMQRLFALGQAWLAAPVAAP